MQETESGTTHTHTQIEKATASCRVAPVKDPQTPGKELRKERRGHRGAAGGLAKKRHAHTHTHTQGGSGTEDYPRSSHSTLSTNRIYSHNMQQERTGKEEGRESAGSKLSEIYHNKEKKERRRKGVEGSQEGEGGGGVQSEDGESGKDRV